MSTATPDPAPIPPVTPPVSVAEPEVPVTATPERVRSIDALRGFDMFWIIGGEELAVTFARWTNRPDPDLVHEQMTHVEWAGFHFIDLIFPLFLFLVGVVLPFSIGNLRARGAGVGALAFRVTRRAALLILLGLVYNGLLRLDFSDFRYAGVLQRIGLCYFFAALATLILGVRAQLGLLLAILLGYWALLRFVAAPGFAPFDLTPEGCLPSFIDQKLLPGRLYYGHGDNEGLLSTLPAIGTTLLGVLAGHWLRSSRGGWAKVLGLLVAGLVCAGVGLAWSQVFPIIKILWTSSYVLFAGGLSFLLLALFYAVIDVMKLRAWAFPFVVIGANAITIYIGQGIIDFVKIADYLFGGVVALSGAGRPFWGALAFLAAEWVFLWLLYRKRVFLRV